MSGRAQEWRAWVDSVAKDGAGGGVSVLMTGALFGHCSTRVFVSAKVML